MRNSLGSPGARRASSGRLVFPEYRTTGRSSIGRISVNEGNTSAPASPSHRRSSHRRSDASRNSLLQVASIMTFVKAGNRVDLEKFLSGMSANERELAFAAETVVGGNRSLVATAVKCGDLAVVRTILKWLPEGQVGTALMAKDDDDGKTVLMLAASAGNPEVLELVASRLPRAQLLKHLTEKCVRGNLVFSYAAKTGKAAMIEAILVQFPPDEVADALRRKNFEGETPLLHAAGATEPGAFRVIAKTLSGNELAAQLNLRTEQGQTALSIATRAGNASTWKAVASKMSATTVNSQLISTDIYGETAVMLSVRSGSAAVFRSVVGCLTEDQILALLGARNKLGQTPIQVAVACGAESVLVAMLRPEWTSACVLDATDESEAQFTALDLAALPPANLEVIKCLLACGATPTSRFVQKLLRNCREGGGGTIASGGGGVSAVRECFLGAMTASEWAINPLIPGLKLYVAIVATKRQHSCFKNNLVKLKSEIDALILCILRHLPDTVEGFDRFSSPRVGDGGSGRVAGTTASSSTAKLSLSSSIVRDVSVAGGRGQGESGAAGGALRTSGAGIIFVQEMLEPELAGLQPRHCSGPLAQAMQSRHVEFIYTPLVVDYLRRKFSAGLPNPFRETKWRREHGRVDRHLARFMLDEDESKLVVYILQGGCADSPSWTYLPGLQFILAGVCGKTAAFFGVPAMRLALDVLVYMGVVTVFVLKVVVLQDASTITAWEFLWLVYIVGAIWKQRREVQEAGSIRIHLTNPWNLVEATSLASLSAGFFFRMWAYVCVGNGEYFCGQLSTGSSSVSDLNEVYLAQYFQAASAPFVFGKVLFLTQIHSSLGPLLHSTFNMMKELSRFGALMLVITFGFALAFHAMFGSTSASQPDGGDIAEYDTYYSSLLTLFASMLGNFDFAVFDGAPMSEAGVVLLAFFLCVMNITLLNLLIAILATAHARVEKNADKEAVLSEAVIITQYRRAMRLDSLPAPLNVPQELISYLFWRRKEKARELFARAVFWLVSGPIAISATAVLWTLSIPLTLAWAARVLRSSGSMMLVPALLGICFNLGLAPLVTAWLWLRGVAGVWQQGYGTMETSDHNEIEVSRAHRRGTYVGSPISTVASAAVAVKLATTGKPALDPVDERRASLPGRSASKLWQRAAQVGGGCVSDASGTVRHLGFNAVAAIRALHGVSVQQLKRRLDECYARREEDPFRTPGFSTKGTAQHQPDRGFAEALAGLKKGHDRLEEMIRKADDNRARMEAKLDQVFKVLSNSAESGRSGGGGGGGDGLDCANTAVPCTMPEEETPPTFVTGRAGNGETSPVVAARESSRGTGGGGDANGGAVGSVVVGGGQRHSRHQLQGGGNGDDSDRPQTQSSEPDLDEFIDQYHAELR